MPDPDEGPTKEVRFTGLRLLSELFAYWPDVLFFNVMWAVLSVCLQTAVGVGAALLLDRPGVHFKNFWRAVFILPWAIPEFVGALIWLRVFVPDYGMLSQALPTGFSMPPISDDPNTALIAMLIAATWGGFPLIMLAASAGLKLIPKDVFDAAAMDGVNAWQRFRYMTLPLLWPLVAPAIIIRAIFAFNQYYLFWVMGPPDPLYTFTSISYYLISNQGQYAVSAALNIFTVIVLVALLLWLNRVSKAEEGVTYA
jgi:arabinogalactan oligomer/maltooligosaccharide transport system permease protein